MTRDRQRAITIGCVTVYAVGTIAGWLSPQVLFGAMQKYGVSAAEAGTLTLVEGAMAGLLSMALGAMPPPVTHRRLAVASFFALIVINGVTPWVPSFMPLVVLRLLAGVADAVLLFVGVSLTAMCSANPDRGYAIMTVAGSIYGALILVLLPIFSPEIQGLAYLPFSATTALLMAPLLRLMPADTRPGRLEAAPPGRAAVPIAASGRLALFVVVFAIMVALSCQAFAVFAFAPGLGGALGMSDRAVSTALSGATLASIAGPFAGAWATSQFGRWLPFFVMAMAAFASNLAMTRTGSEGVLVFGLMVSQMAAYYFVPITVGWAAEVDPSGRHSSIMMGGMFVTTAVTPTLAGGFIDRGGLAAMSQLVLVTGLAALALFVLLYLLLTVKRRESLA